MDIQPYSGTSTIQHLISKSRDFIFLVNLMSTRLCVKASLQNGLNQIIFRPLIFPIFQLELYAVFEVKNPADVFLPKQNVRTKRTNNYHNLTSNVRCTRLFYCRLGRSTFNSTRPQSILSGLDCDDMALSGIANVKTTSSPMYLYTKITYFL